MMCYYRTVLVSNRILKNKKTHVLKVVLGPLRLRRFKTGGLYISINTGGDMHDMREAMIFLPKNRFPRFLRHL